MNAMDNHLERLLKAAADTPCLVATESSFTHKARVLAHWRVTRSQPKWFDFQSLLQRGLAWACVLALVVAGAGLAQLGRNAPDQWSFASTVVNLTLTP
jgi:hypothetical protein